MKPIALACAAFALLSACTVGADNVGSSADVGDQEPLEGADDSGAGAGNVTLAAGDLGRVCGATALNLRSGPGTQNDVLKVIPNGSTVQVVSVEGNWIENEWNGTTGWSSASYLCSVEAATAPVGEGLGSADVSRDSFLSIAQASVGFSYYWGGGRLSEGASHGACYGSCPSCRHEGSYGADCSGFMGKVWLLPSAMPMDANKHPYSTASFAEASSLWKSTSRGTMQAGDALVYRSGGSGHVFMYEKDDPWGQFWAYEARGCSYGIVHNIRSAGSAYKAIRRTGV